MKFTTNSVYSIITTSIIFSLSYDQIHAEEMTNSIHPQVRGEQRSGRLLKKKTTAGKSGKSTPKPVANSAAYAIELNAFNEKCLDLQLQLLSNQLLSASIAAGSDAIYADVLLGTGGTSAPLLSFDFAGTAPTEQLDFLQEQCNLLSALTGSTTSSGKGKGKGGSTPQSTNPKSLLQASSNILNELRSVITALQDFLNVNLTFAKTIGYEDLVRFCTVDGLLDVSGNLSLVRVLGLLDTIGGLTIDTSVLDNTLTDLATGDKVNLGGTVTDITQGNIGGLGITGI